MLPTRFRRRYSGLFVDRSVLRADILLDQQGTPTAPSAGQGVLYFDNDNEELVQRLPTRFAGDMTKGGSAQIAAHSADTYYLGMKLPDFSMQVDMCFEWTWYSTKGAAGTATPIYTVRIGAAGTTADTARLTLTGPAQTAAADIGFFRVRAIVRSVGVAGVLHGIAVVEHNLAATGFANAGPAGTNFINAASAGFDNTALGGQFIGLSVNPGASGAWVTEQRLMRCWY